MTDRSVIVVFCTLVALHCGNRTGSLSGVSSPSEAVTDCQPRASCLRSTLATPDTDWHPDGDGDGILSTVDRCPHIYDPLQRDGDGDGIGDFCDLDFVGITADVVADLRAQHVTPFGGWFSFRSPTTAQYGRDYVLGWSTNPNDLRTAAGMANLDPAHKVEFRVFAKQGNPIAKPIIVTGMTPGRRHYVSVRARNDLDKLVAQSSNIVEIQTAPAPKIQLSGIHPRTWASPEQLRSLRARHQNRDKSFAKWRDIMSEAVVQASHSIDKEDFSHCISAAVLWHATNEQQYRGAALRYIATMRRFWAATTLERNQLRWADSTLAICTDLMWNDLTAGERNQIVSTYLQDDEAADIGRMVDTDEFASITRTWVIDGLVGCRGKGLAADLSARACKLLERGIRAFYGVQLVKARRDRGFFAQSGGALPDGIDYALGTSKYWLQTLYALGKVDPSLNEYGPWIWHNLLSMQIHALTPMGRGLATYGDLDSYDNFDKEPNSLPLQEYNGGMLALHAGLLERAGMPERAAHARWHLERFYPEEDVVYGWAMLLMLHDGMASHDNRSLAPSYYDSGLGILYDRTGWHNSASYMVFKAGWSGADHSHQDAGSFQLYRKGVWLTHESLGYDGPAAGASSHNVPGLKVGLDGKRRIAQFAIEPAAGTRIIQVSTNGLYSYVSADLTGAYTSGKYQSDDYTSVIRTLFWLKPSKDNGDDRLFVLDRIAARKDVPALWQLHIDATPTLSGSFATFSVPGSQVQVTVALPRNAGMQYQPPKGVHSQYPGEVYTGRLTANTQTNTPVLSVLRASDHRMEQPVRAVSSRGVSGVVTGDDLVLFSDDPAAKRQSVTVSTTASLSVWWTGLLPLQSYTLAITHRSQATVYTLTRQSDGTSPESEVVLRTDNAGVLTANPR